MVVCINNKKQTDNMEFFIHKAVNHPSQKTWVCTVINIPVLWRGVVVIAATILYTMWWWWFARRQSPVPTRKPREKLHLVTRTLKPTGVTMHEEAKKRCGLDWSRVQNSAVFDHIYHYEF